MRAALSAKLRDEVLCCALRAIARRCSRPRRVAAARTPACARRANTPEHALHARLDRLPRQREQVLAGTYNYDTIVEELARLSAPRTEVAAAGLLRPFLYAAAPVALCGILRAGAPSFVCDSVCRADL